MPMRLQGSTSGYAEINAPAVAGNNALILPGGNGTADQVLSGNGSGTLSWVDRGRMTLATAQNTTSGTAIDFTGIPSWVKRVTVMFNGVSTNGTSNIQIQFGTSSGVETTGYGGSVLGSQASAIGNASFSTGFAIDVTTAASDIRSGIFILGLVASNIWAVTGSFGLTNTARSSNVAGTKQLSATLDRIRITTVNGTDTFDAGNVNILYEG